MAQTIGNNRSGTGHALQMKKQLREQEVAEIYGISVKTLQAWRWKHIGPAYAKVGRCVRYSPDVLDAYFAANTVQTQG